MPKKALLCKFIVVSCLLASSIWICVVHNNFGSNIISNFDMHKQRNVNVTHLNKQPGCHVLYKTHKLTVHIFGRIKKSYKEISAYNCSFIVLYWISFGVKTTDNKTKANINMLTHNNIPYLLINDTLFEQYLPKFYNDVKNKTISWMKLNTKKGFEWNSCDIPELLWYKYNEKNVGDYDNIWMMEYDVGWKGNIGDILIKGYNLDKELNEFGYLGYDFDVAPWAINGTWGYHRHKHEGFDSSVNSMAHCLVQLVRYKGYLLKAMNIQLSNSLYVYCEARAASICQKILYINNKHEYLNESCKHADIWKINPDVIIAFEFFSYAPARHLNTFYQWQHLLQNDQIPDNTLYHPLKF